MAGKSAVNTNRCHGGVFAALLGNDAAALRSFAGRSSLGTCVAVIATRSATRGFARQRLVIASSTDSDLNQAAGAADADPAHELIDAEQHRRLHVMLSRLPSKQRDLVQMLHLQGRSYSEISDDLHRTTNRGAQLASGRRRFG